MSQCDKQIPLRNRGSSSHKGFPECLVVAFLGFLVMRSLILIRGGSFLLVIVAASMLWLAKQTQSVPGSCASQHACCCCSRPLQALFGQASTLSGGRLFVVIFSFSFSSEEASSLTVCILWAQSCQEQHQNPKREKLLLGNHFWSCIHIKTIWVKTEAGILSFFFTLIWLFCAPYSFTLEARRAEECGQAFKRSLHKQSHMLTNTKTSRTIQQLWQHWDLLSIM